MSAATVANRPKGALMVEIGFSRRLLQAVVWSLACILLCNISVQMASAVELEKAKGPVVLTIAGNVSNTNRPAFAESEDAFLNYHEKKFDSAAEFDLAMLESLGMQKVVIDFEGWPAPTTVEGPRLNDVLAAAGAAGKDIAVVALDGYASEISAAEVASLNWIVGLKRDGRHLKIGQRGPLWVVYNKRDGSALTAEDELRWPWAAFYIEVR